MAGTTASVITKKMNHLLDAVRRDLMYGLEAMSEFKGYLESLADVGMITENERHMFNIEFDRLVLEPRKVVTQWDL